MIIQFFLSLSLLIVLHEWGQYITAKWFKTRVEKFYLFFDPWFSVVKKKVGETEYGIGWLPLGGYVKISGMIDESMDKEQMKGPPQPWEFRSKKTWQRLIIMLGGVIVNFILGFFIFAMMLWQWGESYLPTSQVTDGIYVDSVGYEMGLRNGDHIVRIGDFPFVKFSDGDVMRHVILDDARNIKVRRNGQLMDIPVDDKYAELFASSDFKDQQIFSAPYPLVIKKVDKRGPAADADLMKGDRIIAVNEASTPQAIDFLREIRRHKSTPVQLTVVRNNQERTFDVITKDNGTIGIHVEMMDHFYEMASERYGFLESFPAGVKKGMSVLMDQIKAFGKIISGKIKATESLGGPIMIATMFPTEWNAQIFWRMTAILSLILGFMNLLPIPALDGGHVLFLLWEMISGKKPSDKFMEIMTLVGFVILLAFMVFVFGNDIRRFFF